MGLLKLFSRSSSDRTGLQRLPSGSVTVDRTGTIVMSTVLSGYPGRMLEEIAREVLRLFREARTQQMPLAELEIHFASLQITAREARGGAIIFLSPKTPGQEAAAVEVRSARPETGRKPGAARR